MKSPYNFIISPYGSKYNNTKNIGGVEFTINTSLELAKYVNRLGIVESLPIHYSGDICVGDIVVLHHNIFRIYFDMRGRPTTSPEFFRDGVYIVSPERIYLSRNVNGNDWTSHLNYCFVKPIDNTQEGILYDLEKEEKHIGELVYANEKLLSIGFKKGDMIAFKKNSEYEFEIDDEKLYRMSDSDIVLKLN